MEQLKELSDKELVFCRSYINNRYHKGKAAIEAIGARPDIASQAGYEMYNRPHVNAYIKKLINETTIDGEQTLKLVSQIAESDIKDYYKPVKVLKVVQVEKYLTELIQELQNEIEIKEEFCAIKGYTESQYDEYQETVITPISDQILMYELELKRNPAATRIINTESLVEEMQLDINMLIADKERGKIKKVKYGKDGLEVEMYAADAAHDKLLKVHGKYEKDNKQKAEAEKQTIIINGKEIEF